MPAASARAPHAEHAAGCAYEQAQDRVRIGSQRDRRDPKLEIVSSGTAPPFNTSAPSWKAIGQRLLTQTAFMHGAKQGGPAAEEIEAFIERWTEADQDCKIPAGAAW